MTATADKSPDVLVVESLGRTRYLTPEGFLYCEGVRVSSTRPMIYRAEEIPEVTPRDGTVVMHREPDVLFSDETLASFQGKAVTNNHPSELLTPADWKAEAVGVVLNPRRGEGVESDYLIADLMITDAEAIDAVQSGRREVSCGYDGEREETTPGVGRFTRIIGNHVALVERGRCGPACAIGDEQKETTPMAKRTVIDRLRTAFKAHDESAFEEELEAAKSEMDEDEPQKVVIEVRGPDVRAEGEAAVEGELAKDDGEAAADPMAAMSEAIAAIMSRLDAIEASVAKSAETVLTGDEAEEGEGEKKDDDDYKTMDAATVPVMRSAFQEVVAKAEILSPGIKLPTFDAKASKKTIGDAMCGLRMAALKRAYGDATRKEFVTKIIGDKPAFDSMACDAATMAFNAAAELARAAANAPRVALDHQNFPQGKMTPAKLQELNVERRKKSA